MKLRYNSSSSLWRQSDIQHKKSLLIYSENDRKHEYLIRNICTITNVLPSHIIMRNIIKQILHLPSQIMQGYLLVLKMRQYSLIEWNFIDVWNIHQEVKNKQGLNKTKQNRKQPGAVPRGQLGVTHRGPVFLTSILNFLWLLTRSSSRGVSPSAWQKGRKKVIQRNRNFNDEILSCS